MRRELRSNFVGPRVDEEHSTVVPARGDGTAVRGIGDQHVGGPGQGGDADLRPPDFRSQIVHVGIRGGQGPAIRAEGQRVGSMAPVRPATVERVVIRRPLRIPEPGGAVLAGGGHGLAVRREGHAPDAVPVAANPTGFLLGRGLPQPDRLIVAPRGDRLAVGCRRNGEDRTGLIREEGLLRAAVDVPEPCRLIVTARGHDLAVRRDRQGEDRPAMPGEGCPPFPGLRPPQRNGPGDVSRGQGLAVGGEGDMEGQQRDRAGKLPGAWLHRAARSRA